MQTHTCVGKHFREQRATEVEIDAAGLRKSANMRESDNDMLGEINQLL